MKPLEQVSWRDSYGASSGWESLDGFTPNTLVVNSAGYLVFENEDIISLASSYAPETDRTPEQVNGIMTIPKCCIINRKQLDF